MFCWVFVGFWPYYLGLYHPCHIVQGFWKANFKCCFVCVRVFVLWFVNVLSSLFNARDVDVFFFSRDVLWISSVCFRVLGIVGSRS